VKNIFEVLERFRSYEKTMGEGVVEWVGICEINYIIIYGTLGHNKEYSVC
jgi:hypothetical protein